MTLAAIGHWNQVTGELFENAGYRRKKDPRDRVLGYIDFRKSLLRGPAQEFTCLLGTLVQETFESHPRLREACHAGISAHARTIERDLVAAKALHAPDAALGPEGARPLHPGRAAGRVRPRQGRGATPPSPATASTICDNTSLDCWVRRRTRPHPRRPRHELRRRIHHPGADRQARGVPKARGRRASRVFKEYGALDVVDCWGDDVPEGKLTSFTLAVKREEGESVVFSWISWPSREFRDEAWKKVMADPRMQTGEALPFDGKRMIYGGFEVLLTA